MALIAAVIAAYMLLLTAFALATPSIGTFGTLLTLIPTPWRNHAHLPAYGLLAYLVMWGLRRSEWPLSSAIMTGLSMTFIFGFYTELLQHVRRKALAVVGDHDRSRRGLPLHPRRC